MHAKGKRKQAPSGSNLITDGESAPNGCGRWTTAVTADGTQAPLFEKSKAENENFLLTAGSIRGIIKARW